MLLLRVRYPVELKQRHASRGAVGHALKSRLTCSEHRAPERTVVSTSAGLLERALKDAADDHEAAAAEAAATRCADALRRELQEVEALAEAARQRRRSLLEEPEAPPAVAPAKPPAAGNQQAPSPAAGKQQAPSPAADKQQKADEEESSGAKEPAQKPRAAATYPIDEDDDVDDDSDGCTGAAFRMVAEPQQQHLNAEARLKRVAAKAALLLRCRIGALRARGAPGVSNRCCGSTGCNVSGQRGKAQRCHALQQRFQ